MPQPMYIPTENTTSFEQKRICTRLGTLFWLLAVVLGALHAWAWRDYMDPDSIAYVDIGDAYFARDWHNAINAQWNPMYSWILGAANHLVKPSTYWEFPLDHAVDFACFLFALGCFDFFLRRLLRCRRLRSAAGPDAEVPDWVYRAVAYPLFLWGCLVLIARFYVGPDILIAAIVFLASGILLRIRAGNAGWPTFAALGIALGCGYLLKPVMFPVAFVFLAIAFLAVGRFRRAVPRVLLAFLVFLCIGSPFIAAISKAKGRLTYGESGKLVYAFDVNDVNLHTDCDWCNYHVHWRGAVPGTGTPKHPTRIVLDKPVIYEFATPIVGTYPPWYDPTYWDEGIRPHFEFWPQLKRIGRNTVAYIAVFSSNVNVALIVGFLALLFLLGDRWRPILRNAWSDYWVLAVPSVVVLGMYYPYHIENRFIGGYVALIWMALFAAVLQADVPNSKAVKTGIAMAVMFTVVLCIGWSTLQGPVYDTVHDFVRGEEPSAHMQWQVATGLQKMGIKPGDRVALMNMLGFDETWARLARVRIVAEMPDARDFWAGDQGLRERVIQTYARTGAKVIVTSAPPRYAAAAGWVQLGRSTRYAYFLQEK